jgi:hypothetical protein
MPTNTDLVTDLPADFEVFGQAVATSMADLLGGTTGQVLKKNTNTDMDFVWSSDNAGMTNPMTTTGDTIYSSSGSTPARLGIGSTGQGLTVVSGIPAWTASATSTLTTTGDILYASAANTLARRAIGSTGEVLTVAGGVPTWAAPAAGGMTLISTTTLAGTTTLSSIPGTYNTLQLQIYRTKNSAGDYGFVCYPNNQTLATDWISNRGTTSLTFGQDDYIRFTGTTNAMANNQDNAWTLTIFNYASSTACKPYTISGGYYNNGKFVMMTSGFIRDTSAITSLVLDGAGSSNSGTVLLYGVK